jgi:CRP-like cAMP-binding protein
MATRTSAGISQPPPISVATPVQAMTPVHAGERTDPSGRPINNHLLLSIPDDEFALLRPHLEFLMLEDHLILQEPRQRIECAYFPNGGMVSLVVTTTDGRSVEVGLVGREGIVGALLIVGLDQSPYRAVMQISGDGIRLRAATLKNNLASTPHLHLMLNRYAHMQGLQMAQIAACNRLHDIDQRLARWLLMSQDRVDSEWLPITHDFLATMLGTGRPTVSLAAGLLQRKGLIQYVRGAVRVVDRKGLESAACECYGVVQQYNGTLGLK